MESRWASSIQYLLHFCIVKAAIEQCLREIYFFHSISNMSWHAPLCNSPSILKFYDFQWTIHKFHTNIHVVFVLASKGSRYSTDTSYHLHFCQHRLGPCHSPCMISTTPLTWSVWSSVKPSKVVVTDVWV